MFVAIASISVGNGDIIGTMIVDAIDKFRPYGLSMGKGSRDVVWFVAYLYF